MSDIFISYSRYDSDKVNELVALLEQEGYSIWIDRDGIESGDDFKRVILKAIKESTIVLFFSSKHSNVSDWTAKEIGIAVKYKKHIIPILLDDSNFNEAVEFDLINLDYVDYTKVSIRLAMRERLLKTLRNKIGKENNPTKRNAKSFNDYEYVDLGLPSGTLWAVCNIGANKPEEYGYYFAWGETRPKQRYSWDTHMLRNTHIVSNILQADSDAATVNWGGSWSIPTEVQWRELFQNTTNSWTMRNGVMGRFFRASNGKSLFLPAAGYCNDSEHKDAGSGGHYWSSSLCPNGSRWASGSSWYFHFYSDRCYIHYDSQYNGLSVRPVRLAK